MSRYINEIEFLNALVKKRTYSSKTIGEALDEASSVEIVRCEECKHWHYNDLCGIWDSSSNADDFCSYGCREANGEDPCRRGENTDGALKGADDETN